MNTFNYSEINTHKTEHHEFIKKVSELEKATDGDSDTYGLLAGFIYDWLISHISNTDRIMVAKLKGDHTDFAGDYHGTQTRSVIDSAFTLAGLIERTSVELTAAPSADRRAELAGKLAEKAERLINLICLAQTRVERFGCSDLDLKRLLGMKGAVNASVRLQLQAAVAGLVSYGLDVTTGKNGLPFGAGAAVRRRVEHIGFLLQVIGGFKDLSAPMKIEVEKATEIANEVVVLEANAVAMQNFQIKDRSVQTRSSSGSVGNAYDQEFIAMAQYGSRKLGFLLEQAVKSDQIGIADLFDDSYVPVPGTNPEQFTAKCLAVTNQLFPPVQEDIMAADEAIILACAIDRNGYLPTHNRKYALPQGEDPVWNAAHCRNGRIFNDKAVLAAARNTTPILLQTYLRDMGGGNISITRGAASPIWVHGSHWGSFCIAYRLEEHRPDRGGQNLTDYSNPR